MNLPGYSGSSDLHLAKLAATDSTLHFHTCPQNPPLFPSKPQLLPLKSPPFPQNIYFCLWTLHFCLHDIHFCLQNIHFWIKNIHFFPQNPLTQSAVPNHTELQIMSCEKNSHHNALVKCLEENWEQVEALKQAYLWGRLNFTSGVHFQLIYLKWANFSGRILAENIWNRILAENIWNGQIFQSAHILGAGAPGVHFPRISIAISHADIFHRLSPRFGRLTILYWHNLQDTWWYITGISWI